MSKNFSESFIQYLQSMEGDRGKLAILRKGLIENQAQATWPLLHRFIDFDKPYNVKALQTVAGLFAHHSKASDSGNFGSLCHQMLDSDEKQKMTQGDSGPISRHFQYALAADGEEIFSRVRRLVLRAKREEIAVNYVQLVDDLLGWSSSFRKDRIRLAWGKEFWRARVETDPKNTDNEAAAV
jgi:CRISPR type I-E-associated protein CasB/Cse2